MASRASLECTVGQLAQRLRNVSNEHTVPIETLVVDSNLAVTNCIEMDQNVCIGIVGYTGIQPYDLPRTTARSSAAGWSTERTWTAGPTGSTWPLNTETAVSRHSLLLTVGFTGSFPYQNVNNIQIGNSNAVSGQNIRNIAIGDEAAGSVEGGQTGLAPGQNDYNIAMGYRSAYAGQDHANIAIGNDAASIGGQIYENIAIGDQAAQNGQVAYNVAIGDDVVPGGQLESNVAIGTDSSYDGQNYGNVAIGASAASFQDENNVAIGVYCGNEQLYGNVAIGYEAANGGQNTDNIAIGDNAAYWGQSYGAIAIGGNAGASGGGETGGYQNDYSIAIGYSAGASADIVPEYSIQLGYQANVYSNYTPEGIQNTGLAIGTNASSTNGALVLNTDINGLSSYGPGLFIQPINPLYVQSSNVYLLQYDNVTKEIVYGPQMISGIASGSVTGNGIITFGVTFVNPPVVTATLLNPGNTSGGAMYSVAVGTITTTACFFYARYLANGGSITGAGESICWTAVGIVQYPD